MAHARVRKIGRTVSVCDIDVYSEEGKLLAIGRGTYATAAG
ncbi:hotdog domain-containing protein [Haliea sp.]